MTLGKWGSGPTPCSNGVIGRADWDIYIGSAGLVFSVNTTYFNNGLINTLKELLVLCNEKNRELEIRRSKFWALSDQGPCAPSYLGFIYCFCL